MTLKFWNAVVAAAVMAAASPLAAHAAADTNEIGAIRAALEQMKVEQAARATEMQQLEARLDALEASAQGASPAMATVAAPTPAIPAAASPRLQLSGDFRLRYEDNTGDAGAADWDRAMLRARLQAQYAVTERLLIGGRVATGDPDDPNSSDITLSNFDDDLAISLDQAYAQYDIGSLRLWGGKFAVPFVRTDLVWDGDVNPQGIGGTYQHAFAGGTLSASGLYFLVDETVAGPDSSMIGGQIAYERPIGEAFKFDVAAAEYDYSLDSVAGADTGDFRTNVIGPDGRYVSDFDLFDVIAGISWTGAGSHWPVRIAGEYVHNAGARVDGDTAYAFDLTAGQLRRQGDWRFAYGYAVAEVDAVLAAFSQDNTTIGTNYRQHALSVNYALLDRLVLDATYYRYQPYDSAFAAPGTADDWLNRMRINLQVAF